MCASSWSHSSTVCRPDRFRTTWSARHYGGHGSHGTDFAPGVRVAWIGDAGLLNVGRVLRVQTVWTDRSFVHVHQVDRGAAGPASHAPDARPAVVKIAQAAVTAVPADELFRVAEGADPFAWQDGLRAGDDWDIAGVREFVVAQIARLTRG